MHERPKTQAAGSVAADGRWQGLYKAGGVAAPVIAVLLACEIAVFGVWPQPTTAIGYFKLFQSNWLIGLLDLDLLGMVAYALFVPVILALYFVLRRISEGLMAVATALFFVGISAFFATNTAFSLLSLSQQYTAAATETQRSLFLAAGEAMLTTFNVGAFQVSYAIVSAAWLMIATVMLRSSIFGKATACSGILAGATAIMAIAMEHTPVVGDIFWLLISAYFAAIVFLAVWVVLTGRRLYRLGIESVA